jgi:3-phosphoshikimate 1-carboxyvinyltransferase
MSLVVPVPRSKSMTQRALLIAALSERRVVVHNPLDCDDSRRLRSLLEHFGCRIDWCADSATVAATSLKLKAPATIDCGNAGTAVRFGSCLALLSNGRFVIDGNEHMRKRPLGPLGQSLRQLGVQVDYLGSNGCPPVALQRQAPAPAKARVDASQSSQYASGLLLVAPRLAKGLRLELCGKTVSQPYLEMTRQMMQHCGASVRRDGQHWEVAPGGYTASEIAVEPDWSAAAFLLAAGWLCDKEILPVGMVEPAASLQGDAAIASMLARIDQEPVNRFDLTEVPDLIAPLAAACAFAKHPTRIVGAAHTRIKECDRVAVLCRGLRQLGFQASEQDDGLDLEPSRPHAQACQLDPHDDHRMAMAFGILSLRLPNIRVKTPECVSKSFPNFWEVLSTLQREIAS